MPTTTNRQAGKTPTGKGNSTSWAAVPKTGYAAGPLSSETEEWTVSLGEPSADTDDRLNLLLAERPEGNGATAETINGQAVDGRDCIRVLAALSPIVDGNLLNSLADDFDEAVARAAQANPKLKATRIEKLFANGAAHADVILARADIRAFDEEFVADRVVNGYQHERLAAAKNKVMFKSVLEDLRFDTDDLVRMYAIGTLRTRGDLVEY